MKYSIIIQWSEIDNCYIASVPELPGCMADGNTQEKCLQNLQVIIEEWIETAKEMGREVPLPKVLETA